MDLKTLNNLFISYLNQFFQKPFDPDNRNTYKTNTNPKINILMSENIGQRRLNFFSGIFRCFILSSF